MTGEHGGRQNYDSGEAYVLEYDEMRFTYNQVDFKQRLEYAAKKLKFIKNIYLEDDELEDLVKFCVDGSMTEPLTALGYRLEKTGRRENMDVMFGDSDREDTFVHWLRRMAFRGAWLDQRLIEGELDIEFDEDSGDFLYILVSDGEPIVLQPGPSWEYRT